jgi:hypothetical protein
MEIKLKVSNYEKRAYVEEDFLMERPKDCYSTVVSIPLTKI